MWKNEGNEEKTKNPSEKTKTLKDSFCLGNEDKVPRVQQAGVTPRGYGYER